MPQEDQIRDDIADYVHGRLEPERAGALEEAARNDAALREAIRQERALDGLLELYEAPEPGEGFRARFWKEFHEGRSYGQSGRLLRWMGPVVAAALIVAGFFLFFDGGSAPVEAPQTADAAEEVDDAVVEFNEYRYLADPDLELDQPPDLSVAELSLLKLLDSATFAELDEVRHPDDLALARDHELIAELAEEDLE